MKKFALALSIAALVGVWGSAVAGDVTGKVTLKGTPPAEKAITFDDICSALKPPPTVTTTRHYVVGADGGLANVFVYISTGMEGKKFTPPTEPAELDQQGCNYHPYVSAVMVGQPVRIKNSDPIMHNIHALPKVDGNTEFNFAQPSQGDVNDTKWASSITAPEVLVKLKCDVHPWMFAYVGVQSHPYFAVTGKDGSFKIANVPPGKYTLTAYHLKAHGSKPGETQEITVADSPVTANFTVEVPAPQ
jgi:hypothetical protein